MHGSTCCCAERCRVGRAWSPQAQVETPASEAGAPSRVTRARTLRADRRGGRDMRTEASSMTRKQRRDQARLQRRALERAEAARVLRRKRLRLLGIISALVACGIVLVLIMSADASKKLTPNSAESRMAVRDVTRLLRSLPQSGNVLGRA